MPKSAYQKLFQKVWKIFSIYVRKSNADWRGYVACVTCGTKYIWNSGEIHAGHWIHDKLDFDERNVHPQCYKCNYKFNWKKVTAAYGLYMAERYGAKEMKKIIRLANTKGNSYTKDELEKLLVQLNKKIELLP